MLYIYIYIYIYIFVGLIVILIELWIKKKYNISVFLVSIDYHEYFEVISIIFFFPILHVFGVALYF
jgi:hypothetical protein